MKTLFCALIWIVPCLAQQTSLNFTGVVRGTLRGEDGNAIDGGYVSLALAPPHSKRLRQTEWTAITGPGGAFHVGGLNDGRYRLCAQVPQSPWLNPCEWGLERLVVTLSGTAPVADLAIVMKKGAAVPIRLDDPGQLLSQHEGKTPGAELLIGVGNDAFAFLPAPVISRDATGRTHQIVIPFNSTVRVILQSSFFQLADAGGVPLPRARSIAIPVTIPAGQPSGTIRLQVTGGGQ